MMSSRRGLSAHNNYTTRMDIQELNGIKRNEKTSPGLWKLQPGFYKEARNLLEDDSLSRDDHAKALELIDSIVAIRSHKLMMGTLRQTQGSSQPDNLTSEELVAYNNILSELENLKKMPERQQTGGEMYPQTRVEEPPESTTKEEKGGKSEESGEGSESDETEGEQGSESDETEGKERSKRQSEEGDSTKDEAEGESESGGEGSEGEGEERSESGGGESEERSESAGEGSEGKSEGEGEERSESGGEESDEGESEEQSEEDRESEEIAGEIQKAASEEIGAEDSENSDSEGDENEGQENGEDASESAKNTDTDAEKTDEGEDSIFKSEPENKGALVSVKFLKSLPSFMGKDGEELGPFEEDQVADLPEEVADILLKNNVAEETE